MNFFLLSLKITDRNIILCQSNKASCEKKKTRIWRPLTDDFTQVLTELLLQIHHSFQYVSEMSSHPHSVKLKLTLFFQAKKITFTWPTREKNSEAREIQKFSKSCLFTNIAICVCQAHFYWWVVARLIELESFSASFCHWNSRFFHFFLFPPLNVLLLWYNVKAAHPNQYSEGMLSEFLI